jgi:ADP-ribose pyrophosphatase YjhB (NUDIX family)
MIHLESDAQIFNYRAVGIAIVGGRVLLQRLARDDFWTLPGGVVAMMEASTETLTREMREKLRSAIEIERLVYTVENFFPYAGKQYQEVAFYYAMSLPPDGEAVRATAPIEWPAGDATTLYAWHDVNALGEITLYPPFLREGLRRLPASPIHLVVRE